MLNGRGGEVLGQSHFPDCLVLKRGGRGIIKMTPPFKRLLTLSLSFSVATVGDGKKIEGSAVRGQAYRTSRKSRTQEVGTDYESVLPLWDQSQKLRRRLPLSLIFVSIRVCC